MPALLSAAPPLRAAAPAAAPLRRRRALPVPQRFALRTAASATQPQPGPSVLAAPGSTVLVAGASGGVGQLAVASLLARGYSVRALVRSAERADRLFGNTDRARASGAFAVLAVDLRDADALRASGAADGVDAVVCATGTTAFPSKRWDGGNGPEATDYTAVRNLIAATQAGSPNLARFVLISSVGVKRTDRLPYSILNLFGVLKFKGMAEVRARAGRIRAAGRARRGTWAVVACSRGPNCPSRARARIRPGRPAAAAARRRRCAPRACRSPSCVPAG
jgi:NAD(P)-dependent dehydrogenase (short-subunit alcohol dehydrogenase family)